MKNTAIFPVSDQPPRTFIARWIWADLPPDREAHVWFRRRFRLPSRGTRGRCFVTGNRSYELWINGVRLGEGPCPSYPGHHYYDEYDVSDLLREGQNLVVMRGHHPGEGQDGVLKQEPGPAAAIVELEVDGTVVLYSDSEWRVASDPSRLPSHGLITGHRGGWKEWFDASKELDGVLTTSFDDRDWTHAVDLGAADSDGWRLFPRETPPPQVTAQSPVSVFVQSQNYAYGSPSPEVEFMDGLVDRSTPHTVIHANERPPTVLLDYGRCMYGRFEIELTCDQPCQLDLSFGETLHLTRVDRCNLRAGTQRFITTNRRGGRYVALSFSPLTGDVQVRTATFYDRSYPVTVKGGFDSSDPVLDKIWRIGAQTVKNGMQEHYEDSPWREMTLYAGDIVTSGSLSYHAFGAEHLARKCLRQFARIQTEAGLIPCFAPVLRHLSILPEYPACWLEAVWKHYFFWADSAFLDEMLPHVEACVRWYQAHLDDRGLFERKDGNPCPWGRFVDNLSGLPDRDPVAAEQMLILKGLRAAVEIARTVRPTVVAEWAAIVGRMEQAIVSTCWDDREGAFVDSPEVRTISQITNALGLLLELKPEATGRIVHRLLDPDATTPIRAGNMQGMMCEALFEAGYTAEALGALRTYWGGMIERGATSFWEVFDEGALAGNWPQRIWSLCHAFCAMPVESLLTRVLGIRATSPGFSHVSIKPALNDLTWAFGRVPSPRGPIELAAGRKLHSHCTSLDIALPPNTPATITVPAPGPRVGTLWLDGTPVDHRGSTWVRRVRSDYIVEIAADGPRRLVLSTTPDNLFAPSMPNVVEPGSSWDSSPKIVAKPE